MSYAEKEGGVYTGNPIELYKFENDLDPPDWWRLIYTSGDEEVEYPAASGDIYIPKMITRSQLRLATDIRGDSLTVRVARDNPVALLWLSFPPQGSIWLTIYRKHRDDAGVLVVWKGRVRGVSWAGAEAILECEPLIGLLNRPCLRATFQLVCNHQLYDARCGKDAETGQDENNVYFKNPVNHDNPAIITSIDNNKYYSCDAEGGASRNAFRAYYIDPTAEEDYLEYFTSGFVVAANGERRFIKVHNGTDGYIELWQPFSDVDVDGKVDVYAGCNRIANSANEAIRVNTCDFRFGNVANFGGFPAMPVVNPFTRGI